MATDDAAGEPSDGDALWRFSLAFYAMPQVAESLIALQDRDGLDVNMMLFALWLGASGRGRASGDAIAAAERAIGTIGSEIIGPLRALRRRLTHDPAPDVQRLREGVKALELAAEELVQTRLARVAGPAGENISRAARLAAALANFAVCVGPERARAAEAAIIREALEVFLQDY